MTTFIRHFVTYISSSPEAVSYTHLDVYKRQEFMRTGGGKVGDVIRLLAAYVRRWRFMLLIIEFISLC